MRPLQKGALPDILRKKGAAWTAELLNVLARNEKPSEAIKGRYRHDEIKDALLEETHKKCAYCESKVRHITYGDIEHIVPKSRVPAKAYEWENLTLACDVCNTNKGDEYTDDPAQSHERLIDPYIDNPADHFLFLREVVMPRPDSMRAYATEDTIKLTRLDLLERRRERMAFLDGLVRAYQGAEPQYKPMLLRDLYANHLSDSDEYAASSKAYIDHLKNIGAI